MKKDDIIDLKIEDLTFEGLGIGHAQGMAFFVKDSVIGDLVRAKVIKLKKSYGYARVIEILEKGSQRISPACPSARACGGCQLQMMSYSSQLDFKEKKVKNALMRIGGFTEGEFEFLPIIGMNNAASGEEAPFRYRNKAQFPIGKDKNGELTAGFYAGRTHSIIPQTDCILGFPENSAILEIVLDHMRKYNIKAYDEKTGAGLIRHVMTRKGFFTGELMVCLVINGDTVPFSDELAQRLGEVQGMASVVTSINTENTNVIMGIRGECLLGREYIEDCIGDVRYRISAASFFQVNPVQTRRLYETVLDYAGLDGSQVVWDLYCGIGTISLFLAKKAHKVFGVEIIADAVRDARENARLNKIENAQFFEGKAEEIIPAKYEKDHISADVMVVDPPRKGCERALLETMLLMHPKRIVYVSCDPATLARDLKILCEGGYTLQKVQPCDMFPHTVHTETVCLLGR